jgi:hypothetical protein
MLCLEIIALSYEICAKEVNTVCGHKEFLNANPGGT